MGFITAFTDLQDSTGASFVVPNTDGSRPPLVLKLGTEFTGIWSRSGDLGIVELHIATDAAFNMGDLEVGNLQVDIAANFDDNVTIGGVLTLTGGYIDLPAVTAPAAPASGFVRVYCDIADGKAKIKTSAGVVHALW